MYNNGRNYKWNAVKTICIEVDSAQRAVINCRSKIQTKANERERDQMRQEDLQLDELEVLEELP